VLSLLLASIVVVAFVFRFIYRRVSLFEWLFRVAASTITQHRFYETRPHAALVLTTSWLIFVVFLILLYQAGMKELLLRPLQHAIAFQVR
jgi:hypothetical protein